MNCVFASFNQEQLQKIETFLSTINTLESKITMQILNPSNANEFQEFSGKIWLDRTKKLLKINYGKNQIISKNGTITIQNENSQPETFATEDTPAGILLKNSIKFNQQGINVSDLKEEKGLIMLALSYSSPAGEIPVTLYFKEKPVMLLLGWTLENPDGTITQIHLDPENTHMAIAIDESVFKLS